MNTDKSSNSKLLPLVVLGAMIFAAGVYVITYVYAGIQ